MKKISVLLLTVLVAGFMLVGCGGSGDDNKNSQNSDNNNNQNNAGGEEHVYEGYTFIHNGVSIQLNSLMAPVIEDLGKEDAYFESNSCAFQGLDKVYTYGSVVISTYPVDNVDYVYSIELKDDTVETPEGIYIGSSKEDVANAYGTPTNETETAYVYTKGESNLNIMFEDDAVVSIVYMAITE